MLVEFCISMPIEGEYFKSIASALKQLRLESERLNRLQQTESSFLGAEICHRSST